MIINHVLICTIFIDTSKVLSQSLWHVGIVQIQIGRLAERETKENEGQGERVTECEATVARQGADDDDDEDGVDDLDCERMVRRTRMAW